MCAAGKGAAPTYRAYWSEVHTPFCGFEARLQRQRLELDLAERGGSMTEEVRQKADALLAQLTQDEERYDREKKEIEGKAKASETDRDRNRAKDPYFDNAQVMLQIAIVMSSISILSSSRHLFVLSAVLAAVGTFLSLWGFLL